MRRGDRNAALPLFGALSIESNERNWFFGLCFCNTLVIAAVSVVLP